MHSNKACPLLHRGRKGRVSGSNRLSGMWEMMTAISGGKKSEHDIPDRSAETPPLFPPVNQTFLHDKIHFFQHPDVPQGIIFDGDNIRILPRLDGTNFR
jgi:hypothetical protein